MRARSWPALQGALVVDAQGRVRDGLEPLLVDLPAARGAAAVCPVFDAAERGFDLRRGCARRSPRGPRRARACTSRWRCRRCGRRSRSRGRPSPRAATRGGARRRDGVLRGGRARSRGRGGSARGRGRRSRLLRRGHGSRAPSIRRRGARRLRAGRHPERHAAASSSAGHSRPQGYRWLSPRPCGCRPP